MSEERPKTFVVKTFGRSIMLAVISMMVGALVILMLISVIRTWDLASQIRTGQKGNKPVLTSTEEAAKSADGTLQILQSCLTPGMKCYQQSQKATRAVQREVNQVEIYAAYCSSKHPGSLRDIKICVSRLRHQEN